MTSRILNLKIKVLWPLDWSSEQSITCWQWCCNEPLGTALTHSFCVSLVTPLIPQAALHGLGSAVLLSEPSEHKCHYHFS